MRWRGFKNRSLSAGLLLCSRTLDCKRNVQSKVKHAGVADSVAACQTSNTPLKTNPTGRQNCPHTHLACAEHVSVIISKHHTQPPGRAACCHSAAKGLTGAFTKQVLHSGLQDASAAYVSASAAGQSFTLSARYTAEQLLCVSEQIQ